MTAAGLDYVSDGRFMLGLGASGPQVIEGFHGVPYDAPLGRTREIIEICRQVWRREKVELRRASTTRSRCPPEQGTGLGKPLKLINHPVRDRDPDLHRGASGRRTSSWPPSWPRAGSRSSSARRGPHDVWGAVLAAGKARRDPALGELDVVARPAAPSARASRRCCEHVPPDGRAVHRRHGRQGQELLQRPRPPLRLRGGGRADPGPLPRRQEGRGAAEVPEELRARDLADRAPGAGRRAAAGVREPGVTTVNVAPLAGTPEERVRLIEKVRELAS